MGSNHDEHPATYGSSLPALNVQEIVMSDPLQVPQRYLIKNEEEMPKSADHARDLSFGISVIDFSLLSKGSKQELHKQEIACKEWGFFQMVNHGVATEMLQEMKDALAEFFDLELEEKDKVCITPDDTQGYGHIHVVSEDQILDWSDSLILAVYPSRYKSLKYWPVTPKRFSEAIEAYSSEVKRVGEELLRSLSTIMEMEKDTLLDLHIGLFQALRVNYYLQCSMPDKVIGLSPH